MSHFEETERYSNKMNNDKDDDIVDNKNKTKEKNN